MNIRYFKLLSFLIAAVVLNAACVSMQLNPVSGNKRAFGYTWEQEKQIGAEADNEVIAQFGLYENEELSNYVDQLGQELWEVSHLQREGADEKFKDTEFTFRVLNSPVVNAFALPGGYIYVTRGLLSHLNNEAQLAVVLGHEIGHVAARHASQRAAEQQLGQLAIIGGALLGESVGLDGGSILELSSQTAQLLFLKYGRDDERESDELGVEYSAMKQYEASEGAAFFTSLKRISEEEGGGVPSFLSTHPDPGEREQTIPELARAWEEEGYEQNILDEEEYMSMIDGIDFGDNPREGFVENGVFYHPDLEFKFPVPSGFELINQPSSVVMFNEAQDAVIQFAIDSESNSPQASVQSFTNQEGIASVGRNDFSANGINGYQEEAVATMDDGSELHILVSALSYSGNIYTFLSYTTPNQFSNYGSVFNAVVHDFKEVTDPEILNVQPVRLELREVNRSARFSELLPNDLPMNFTPLDLAIINQVELDETIEAGRTIKIPVQ